MSAIAASKRCVLFLQGPLSPLYARLGERLKKEGLSVRRINFCVGDALHWPIGNAHSFKAHCDNWQAFIGAYLDQHHITDLVLHGDRRFYHRIAIEEATRRGIYIAVSELGLLRPDWTSFERNGTSIHSHFPDNPQVIRQIAQKAGPIDFTPRFKTDFLKVAVPDIIYNLLNTASFFLYPHYRRHTIYFPPLEYAAHGLRLLTQKHRNAAVRRHITKLRQSGAPVFLMPLQLAGDFQIRANAAFASMTEALEQIVASFRRCAPENAILLLKTHPLDNGLDRLGHDIRSLAHAYNLKGRLVLADGGNLSDFIDLVRGALTINSTAGFELMAHNIPVKVLSPTLYDLDGLTDPRSLDDFWNNQTPPDPALWRALRLALAATIQVRGTIYDDQGLATLIDTMADRLIRKTLNEPGAYCGTPPRLQRLQDVMRQQADRKS